MLIMSNSACNLDFLFKFRERFLVVEGLFSKMKLAAVFIACAVNATISSCVTYLVCASVFCLFLRTLPFDGAVLFCGFAGDGSLFVFFS